MAKREGSREEGQQEAHGRPDPMDMPSEGDTGGLKNLSSGRHQWQACPLGPICEMGKASLKDLQGPFPGTNTKTALASSWLLASPGLLCDLGTHCPSLGSGFLFCQRRAVREVIHCQGFFWLWWKVLDGGEGRRTVPHLSREN